jgi:hypothetical protein
MKRILLFLFILLSLSQARASDTLTLRQIYNFNVGDTFDYEIIFGASAGYANFSGSYFEIYTIVGKNISANNDTITYTRLQVYPNVNQIDNLIYYNLDSPVWITFDTLVDTPYFSIDTGRLNDGRITNTLNYNNPNSYVTDYCEYGYGIGAFDTVFGTINYTLPDGDNNLYGNYNRILIYFSKGLEEYGTPYQINAPSHVHYTPIPEECAFWNYGSSFNPYFPNDYSLYQVRTGNKFYINSHTYVELLLQQWNQADSMLSMDSLVGYFRNDTTGQKVYFTQQLGGSETLLYDFTIKTDAEIGVPLYTDTTVNTINIGGTLRAEWTFTSMDPFGDFMSSQTLEGVGALIGLFYAPSYCYAEDTYDGQKQIVA